jgi:pimeloyl-ACP methyl ester carboxylesterase
MTFKTAAVALLATQAAALVPRQTPSPPKWGDCPEELSANATAPVECASFAVPLDYSSSNASETLDLSLLRVPAVREPKKGSVLVNFGGPGVGVIASLSNRANMMLATTGGHYDIIGWDPRGTEDTLAFSCVAQPEERAALFGPMIHMGNSSDKLVAGVNWSASKAFADTCGMYSDAQKKGPLIGTAYTARDAMQIVDAVEDDGLLRFWGFSYGTLLGATLAAMFPDRMDRVVLDGVLNAHEYYDGYDIEINADSDATMSEFFKRCFEVTEKCALAHDDNTAETTEAAFWDFFASSKYSPAVIDGIYIDQSTLQRTLRPLLYNPAAWPSLSLLVDGLLVANATRVTAGFTAITEFMPAYAQDEGLGNDSPFGIQGADKTPRVDSLEDFLPIMDEFTDMATVTGAMMAMGQMRYVQWPFAAKERYSGGFKDIKTRKPLLFVGNSFDPTTPLRSAQNMSAAFDGSAVLEHEGVGHCSLRHPSLCTATVIRDYFDEGTMPEDGKKCETAEKAFDVTEDSWDPIIEQFGF